MSGCFFLENIMKKALKRIGKILLGIVAVIAVFLLGTCVYDKICLASEKDLLENQIYGQKVEVDGHRMSVYVSGEGKHTLGLWQVPVTQARSSVSRILQTVLMTAG